MRYIYRGADFCFGTSLVRGGRIQDTDMLALTPTHTLTYQRHRSFHIARATSNRACAQSRKVRRQTKIRPRQSVLKMKCTFISDSDRSAHRHRGIYKLWKIIFLFYSIHFHTHIRNNNRRVECVRSARANVLFVWVRAPVRINCSMYGGCRRRRRLNNVPSNAPTCVHVSMRACTPMRVALNHTGTFCTQIARHTQ